MNRIGAVAWVVLGGCYSPTPPTGAPCPDGICPSSLVCNAATQTCELADTPRDATADGELADSGTDALTADANPLCFGTGLVSVCLDEPPTTTVTLAGVLDTTLDATCTAIVPAQGTEYCVIAHAEISIAATVTAIGTRPLVLIGAQRITVAGTLDAASRRMGGILGAGSNPSSCMMGAAPGARAGGPGGSFGGTGGSGGGSPAPAPAPAVVPTTLRGGCPGRDGDGGTGEGGRGGGAVYLISQGRIEVTGTINASGMSGSGGEPADSGGGGGSGGMIGLDAPDITVADSARIFANGAGGGAGGGSGSGAQGEHPSEPLVAADGGDGGFFGGGNGGAGSAGATLAGSAGTAGSVAAGGGGGGAGVIKVHPPRALPGRISPPPT